MYKIVRAAQKFRDKEEEYLKTEDLIRPVPSSPEQIDNLKKMRKHRKKTLKSMLEFRKMLPTFKSIMDNKVISYESIYTNPVEPRQTCDETFIEELEAFARSVGVTAIGYTKIDRDYIFKDKGVLFDKAIVCIMPMNKEKVAKAPSFEAIKEVFRTYNDLGIAVNKIAAFLREKGFAAQADHPLGGMTLYPPLAQNAGLGWHGKHGLIISP
ncbi:MAG: hypothetical protein ACTSQE_02040 [Candidatus Heimdallarchaeaceae archaeon]